MTKKLSGQPSVVWCGKTSTQMINMDEKLYTKDWGVFIYYDINSYISKYISNTR